MKLEAYERYLRGQGFSEVGVEKRLKVIRDLDRFLECTGGRDIQSAGKEEAEKFAGRLIKEGRNTLENFSALSDYAGWAGDRPLHVAWIELMDCHNALAVLLREFETRHGREIREKIFTGSLPPLGADERERSAYTREITGRMVCTITAEQARQAWFQVQHGIPAEDWRNSDAADREKFLRIGDIDGFLALKRR
jgi:hypothetical protein